MAAEKKTEETALEKKAQETALAEAEELELLETVAGAGTDDLTRDDVLIPFIKIIQSNSDQRTPSSPNFIEGAGEGDICNTATKELLKGIKFIPLVYDKRWVEWGDREKKEGPVKSHQTSEILSQCFRGENNRLFVRGTQHTIVETAIFFGLVLTDTWFESVCITMYGSQLRKAKQIMTFAQNDMISGKKGKFRAPLYYRIYRLKTQHEHNVKGQWQGWVVERDITTSEWCRANNYKFADFIEHAKKTREQLEQEAERTIQNIEMDKEQSGAKQNNSTTPEPPPETNPHPADRVYNDEDGDIPF